MAPDANILNVVPKFLVPRVNGVLKFSQLLRTRIPDSLVSKKLPNASAGIGIARAVKHLDPNTKGRLRCM